MEPVQPMTSKSKFICKCGC